MQLLKLLQRLLEYYFKRQKIFLWCVAEDEPLYDTFTSDELADTRAQWATYHDQKTAGIMGVMPLVRDMPLRITQTCQKHKSVLFKNRRCRLFGWGNGWMPGVQGCCVPAQHVWHGDVPIVDVCGPGYAPMPPPPWPAQAPSF